MKETKRYCDLDIIKICACFLVIFNHVMFFMDDYAGSNTLGAIFYSLHYGLYKIAVPLFIMVTGALLLGKKSSYKDIGRKIFRIFVPLFFISLILYLKETETNQISFVTFLLSFLKDPIKTPYWYLYMLIGLYLVTPFLQKMLCQFKEKDYHFFYLIFLILPGILNLCSIYFNISFSSSFFRATFPDIIGYYMIGYYVFKLPLTNKHLKIATITFLIGYTMMSLSMFLPFLVHHKLSFALDNISNLWVVMIAPSFFYIIRYLCHKISFSKKLQHLLATISDTTFGIYLIHFIIYYMVYFRIQFIYNINPCLGILGTVWITFIVSSILIYIMRKVPILRKFL